VDFVAVYIIFMALLLMLLMMMMMMMMMLVMLIMIIIYAIFMPLINSNVVAAVSQTPCVCLVSGD